MARPVPKSKRQYTTGLNTPAQRAMRGLEEKTGLPMPEFVEPLLPTLRSTVPASERWVHEIKFDGYRLQLHKAENIAKLFTRRGFDWSRKMPAVLSAAYKLDARHAIIDGEAVVLADDGTTDFNELERELSKQETDQVVFFAFDLLYLDGFDLRKVRLLDRKRVLVELLRPLPAGGALRYSEHIPGREGLLDEFCDAGIEGVVSKRADGRYVSGRSEYWRKATCRRRETFAIIGWALKGKKFDGFYLGESNGKDLVYAGKIEGGWTEEEKKKLLALVEKKRVRSPMANVPMDKPKAQWVRPEVLVDVEYRARTKKSGLLRHPSFKGVRRDLMEPRKSKRR